jgi:hypothetical protein
VTYIVEESEDLSRWDAVATNPGAAGGTVLVEIPAAGDRRFLRLRLVK